MRTELIENSPAQRDSKFSNGRLSGLLSWPQGQDIENSHTQPDSKIPKLVFPLSPQRTLRLNRLSAQPDSKFSKLGNRPLSPLAPKNASAQPRSKNSKSFAISGIWDEAHKRSKSKHALFKTEFPIILVRNITDIKDDHNDCKK